MRPACDNVRRLIVLAIALIAIVSGTANARDSVALYDGDRGTFYLKQSLAKSAGVSGFRFGPKAADLKAVVGDWDGDGLDTFGLYDHRKGLFVLGNQNVQGQERIRFRFGPKRKRFQPIAGDWNGDGTSTVGVFDPETGRFRLRNRNRAGSADARFRFGRNMSSPIAVIGDWDGDGADSIGVYDPTRREFKLRNENASGRADHQFTAAVEGKGWVPVAGDWNHDGVDSVALYHPKKKKLQLIKSVFTGKLGEFRILDNSARGNQVLVGSWEKEKKTQVVARLNVGGGDYVDALGRKWTGDAGIVRGSVRKTAEPIGGTRNDLLYQSERWGNPSGNELLANLQVPDGNYLVKLHFVENDESNFAAGLRVFDVRVEGELAIDDLDMYSRVGARKATSQIVRAKVYDGALSINFVRWSGNPQLSALEILRPGGQAGADDGGNDDSGNDDSGNDDGGNDDSGNDDGGNDNGGNDDGGNSDGGNDNGGNDDRGDDNDRNDDGSDDNGNQDSETVRLNAGGDRYVDSQGRTWSADSGYLNGYDSLYRKAVGGTTDDLLYRARRYAERDPNGPELAYRFALKNGQYKVKLHFAELKAEYHKLGGRVFDVVAQGQVVINNLDVFREAGPNAALVKTIRVEVTRQQLTLEFLREIGSPYVSAIEIQSADSSDDADRNKLPMSRTVRLGWAASTDSIDGYQVYFGASPESTVLLLSTLKAGSSGFDPKAPSVRYNSVEDLGVGSGQLACFRVRTFKGSKLSPLSSSVCGKV